MIRRSFKVGCLTLLAVLHQSALQLVDICLQRCVAIGQCEIHLFQLLDLLLEVLHDLLVLPSQGFMLKIVAVDELVMTRF